MFYRVIAADDTMHVTVMWPPPCWCTIRGCVYTKMYWAWIGSMLTKNPLACIPRNWVNPSIFSHNSFVRLTAGTTETTEKAKTKNIAHKQLPVQNDCSKFTVVVHQDGVWGMAIYGSLRSPEILETHAVGHRQSSTVPLMLLTSLYILEQKWYTDTYCASSCQPAQKSSLHHRYYAYTYHPYNIYVPPQISCPHYALAATLSSRRYWYPGLALRMRLIVN